MNREERDEIDADNGYRTVGLRELRLREWASLREDGESPQEFKRLIWRLQQKKYWANKNPASKARIKAYRKQWAIENKERYRAAVNRNRRKYRADPNNPMHIREIAAKRAARDKTRRERIRATVFACAICGAEWCESGLFPLARRKPRFCSQPCKSRACYLSAVKRGVRGQPTGRPIGRPPRRKPEATANGGQ